MAKEIIKIGDIVIEWSKWHSWQEISVDGRKNGGVKIPDRSPGVYEVKKKGGKKRLLIGGTKNLRRMIRECLVTGRLERPYSAGNEIALHEKVSQVVIRWGVTTKPRAVAEELLQRHLKKYSSYPEYYRVNWRTFG